MARKGDRWESPIFSIGSASRSTDIPTAPKVTRKPHRSAEPKPIDPNSSGFSLHGDNQNGYSGNQSGYSGNQSGYSGNQSGYSGNQSGYSGNQSGYGNSGSQSGYNTSSQATGAIQGLSGGSGLGGQQSSGSNFSPYPNGSTIGSAGGYNVTNPADYNKTNTGSINPNTTHPAGANTSAPYS